MDSKRGQVTIFIIIAIVIVAAVLIFILFRSGFLPDLPFGKEVNPQAYMKSCIEDKITEGVTELSFVGGTLNNKNALNFMFTDEGVYRNISYLCYNQNYYYPCVVQEPMLLRHVTDELKDYIEDDVKDCFDGLAKSLDNNYDVVANYRGFDLNLGSDRVVLSIDGKLTLSKAGDTKVQDDLSFLVPTHFYDVAKVAQEIISQEAEFCNFEHIGYMIFYPQYKIERHTTGDGVHIYTIGYEDSEDKFRFAVRGCVIPPGL